MVKTNSNSRFALYTLANILDGVTVVLQIEDTDTHFTSGDKCYLCEVVDRCYYDKTATNDALTSEILRLNKDNRNLRKKVVRLEAIIKKMEN